jgi:hypothetical protein
MYEYKLKDNNNNVLEQTYGTYHPAWWMHSQFTDEKNENVMFARRVHKFVTNKQVQWSMSTRVILSPWDTEFEYISVTWQDIHVPYCFTVTASADGITKTYPTYQPLWTNVASQNN